MIYLDYAGSEIVLPEIAEKYPALCRSFSINPHGGTRQAEVCRRAVLDAERRLLGSLDIPENKARVIWTSGGTEALNLAILGCRPAQVGAVWADAASHHAMLLAARRRAALEQLEITELMPDKRGRLKLPGNGGRTAVVCVCLVNNETGAVQDLRAVRHAAGPDALLIVDASQAVGRIPLGWNEAKVDMLVISSRKVGGPSTGGALIIRRGVDVSPMMFGGGQQSGIRPGTLDTVGIMLFADAVDYAVKGLGASSQEKARHLAAHLAAGLGALKKPACIVISDPETSVPSIQMISFPGYEGAVLKRILAEVHDVVVGTGSACSAEAGEPSHVLTAMGLDAAAVKGALRVSISPWQTTEADIDAFILALKDTLEHY